MWQCTVPLATSTDGCQLQAIRSKAYAVNKNVLVYSVVMYMCFGLDAKQSHLKLSIVPDHYFLLCTNKSDVCPVIYGLIYNNGLHG